MDDAPIHPNELEQHRSSASIETVSSASQSRAAWFCRVLAIFATVLAGVYERAHDSLTALAFGVLGFGLAVVIGIVHPGDREWISSVVVGLVGLAMMKAIFQIVGLEW